MMRESTLHWAKKKSAEALFFGLLCSYPCEILLPLRTARPKLLSAARSFCTRPRNAVAQLSHNHRNKV
jgi:hypothetical protein